MSNEPKSVLANELDRISKQGEDIAMLRLEKWLLERCLEPESNGYRTALGILQEFKHDKDR